MGWLPNSTPILNEDVHSWLHCSRKTFPIFKIEVQHLEILYKLPGRKNIIHLLTTSSIDPTRIVHPGRHTSNYDKMILSRLNEIEALDVDNIIKRVHVNDLVENIGEDLRNNRIRLNNH